MTARGVEGPDRKTGWALHFGELWRWFAAMPLSLELATPADAAAIAALRLAASRELTARYGRGTWSFTAESEEGVRIDLLTSRVYVARGDATLAATLRLSTRMPWLGNMTFFGPAKTPIYLTSMAVAPKLQGQGIGRACLEEVRRIAAAWPADVVRLDAYDAPAGAGEFYRKCGYTEVCRASYNGTPLVFFEQWVPAEQPGVPAA